MEHLSCLFSCEILAHLSGIMVILAGCSYPDLPAVSGQQQLHGGHVQVPELLVSFQPVHCLNPD